MKTLYSKQLLMRIQYLEQLLVNMEIIIKENDQMLIFITLYI